MKIKKNDEDTNGSSESEQIHVVKILGHKKTAKKGFMFFLKFSDNSSEWSSYDCAMIDCPSLLREYMRKNQKVAPKEDKHNTATTSVPTAKKTPNPTSETMINPLTLSSPRVVTNAVSAFLTKGVVTNAETAFLATLLVKNY